MEKKGLSLEAKHKMANITAVCTVLLTLFFGVLIYKQSDQALPLILGIGALIYGPLCFILYLIELQKAYSRCRMKTRKKRVRQFISRC